jgi:hypothetical protein
MSMLENVSFIKDNGADAFLLKKRGEVAVRQLWRDNLLPQWDLF